VLVNRSSSSLNLMITPPNSTAQQHLIKINVLNQIKLVLTSIRQSVEMYIPLEDLTKVFEVKDLKYLTTYRISAASGNGIIFGEMSSVINADTKGIAILFRLVIMRIMVQLIGDIPHHVLSSHS